MCMAVKGSAALSVDTIYLQKVNHGGGKINEQWACMIRGGVRMCMAVKGSAVSSVDTVNLQKVNYGVEILMNSVHA